MIFESILIVLVIGFFISILLTSVLTILESKEVEIPVILFKIVLLVMLIVSGLFFTYIILILYYYSFKIIYGISNSKFDNWFIKEGSDYLSTVLSMLVMIYIPDYFVFFSTKLLFHIDKGYKKTYIIYKKFFDIFDLRIIAYFIAIFITVLASLSNLGIEFEIPIIANNMNVTIEAVVTFIMIDTFIQLLIQKYKGSKTEEIIKKLNVKLKRKLK